MTASHLITILRARWRLSSLVFFLTIALVLLLSLVLPKKYTAEGSVVVDVAPDPINGSMIGAMMNPSIVATQVDIISSDRVARRVIKNLNLDQSPAVRAQWQDETDGEGSIEDWLVELFQKHLDIRPSREGNVIAITYAAPDPAFSAAIVNAFIRAYLDTSIELRTDPAKQYSGFFDARAKAARDAVDQAQAKLSAFQQANGIVATDERLDVETSRLNELSTQLVMAQGLAAQSTSRNAAAARNGDQLAEVLNNPVVANLKVDLSRSEATLQELQTRLGPNHPQVQQAKANTAQTRSRLEAELRRVAGGAGVAASIDSGQVATLKTELDAQRDKLLKLRKDRDAVATLQRDVDNAQKSYDAILQRLDQTKLESLTQQSNVNLLSSASPPLRPSSPKILLNTVASILLGALLAVGLALWRESRDRRVRGTVDLIANLGLPVLGVLPRPLVKRPPLSIAHSVISGRRLESNTKKAA